MALSFNGSSSKLEWAGILRSSLPFTLFGWIKCSSATQNAMVCGMGDTGATGDEFALYADGANTGKLKAFIRAAGGSGGATSTASLSTSWQPFMAVYETTTKRTIYYGGGAAVTDTDSFVPVFSSFDRFVVGTRPKGDSLFFSGDIAEIACWGSALGPTEWATLSGGAQPETVSAGTLVEHWSLLNQGATQVGTVSRTLTATSTTQAATHPITRAGAGLNIDLGAPAALVLAGYAPAVAQEAFGVIAVGAGALTLAGYAPGVQQAAPTSLSPGAAALVLAGHAPGVLQANQPGALTTEPLRIGATRELLANSGGWTLAIRDALTDAPVLTLTGLTTSASGTLTTGLRGELLPGTTYAYEARHATYGRVLPLAIAA